MGSEINEFTVQELVNQGVLAKPLDGNHGEIHPKSSDFVEDGIPFIMASDLKDGGVDIESCKKISEAQAKTLRKGFAKEGDILLSHKATIGRTAVVGAIESEYLVLTPQVTYYRVLDKQRLNPKYLKYYFDSTKFHNLFLQWAGGGSTRLYLGITGQLKLPIILPEIGVQNRIVSVIDDYDKKLILNRQTNQTLEQMAQALFKSWFVDFDPVIDNALEAGNKIPEPLKKKAERRAAMRAQQKAQAAQANQEVQQGAVQTSLHTPSQTQSHSTKPAHSHANNGAATNTDTDQVSDLLTQGLPVHLRALFPSEFEETELSNSAANAEGWIPKGWSIKPVEEIVERLKAGKRYNKKELDSSGKVPVFEQGKDILLGYHNDTANFLASSEEPIFIFGDHTCVTKLGIEPFSISANVIPLKGSLINTYWTFYAVKDLQSFEEYRRHWMEFAIKQVVTPTNKIADFFADITKSLIRKVNNSELESASLSRLRDTLLPKLISGELRLPEMDTAPDHSEASA